MTASLTQLLTGARALLLDFDGPICRIFSGYPAPQVAAELVDVLRRHGLDPPARVAAEPDPLEVLRWTGGTGDQEITRAVEDALCAAERRAVATAEPTPYGGDVIVAARQAGLPVAVVSNNSDEAVTAFLALHRLTEHVSPVIGRAYAQPHCMKPNPDPILRAVRAIGADSKDCLLVGDSLSDISSAHASGVFVVGYANRPHKAEAFRLAGADMVIESMGEIVDALIDQSAGRNGL